MAPTPPRFSLITSAHVSNNPRLVKEADAFLAAGAAVRVVSLTTSRELAAQDRELARDRGWALRQVSVGTRAAPEARFIAGIARETAGRLAYGLGVERAADLVVSRHAHALAAAACEVPADVVVGHNLPALPAAGYAARSMGGALAFDAEDLHSEERHAGDAHDPLGHRAIVSTERYWLRRCRYVTASSDGIADELARRYDLPRPQVVLNTFPRALRDRRVLPDRGEGRGPSIYWFSQTVGPGRGLELALRAVAALPVAAELHLRGKVSQEYRTALFELARDLGAADRLVLHDVALPDDMVALAAGHDVGLAAEQPVSLSRELCVTNKLLTYLLAGTAVAATDTIGQRGIMQTCEGAGFLFAHDDLDALRGGLWALLASPARLARARAAASSAALARYSWEHDAVRLLAAYSLVTGRMPSETVGRMELLDR